MTTPKRLNPSYNIALMASAGTGKTYNLALRVVATLMSGGTAQSLYDSAGNNIVSELAHSKPEKILCLTFTNKAAAEMQNRIWHYLNSFINTAFKAGDNEFDAIAESLSISDPAKIKRLAEKAANRIYADPSTLQVSTIDAFLGGILRRFYLEAGVPQNFEIISESQESLILRQAFLNAFKNINENQYVKLFSDYIRWSSELPYKFTERLMEQIGFVVNRSVTLNQALSEASAKSSNDIIEMLKEALAVVGEMRHVMGKIHKILVEHEGLLTKYSKDRIPSALAFAEGREKVDKIFDIISQVNPEKATLKGKHLPDLFDKLYAELTALLEKHATYADTLDVALIMHLSAMVELYMGKIKRRNGALYYSDVTKYVHHLLSDDAPDTDYLYFKLDGRLEHIMLDEFQDTSSAQWEIIKPLAKEAMAGKGQHEKIGSFFCVGDPKQTIYRFNDSNPNFFHNVIYAERLEVERLSDNYRSDKAIIEFVNALFKDADTFINQKQKLSAHFDFEPHIAKSEKVGYVSYQIIRGANAKERTPIKFEKLKNIMAEIKAKGWSYNDIAIIVHSRAKGIEVNNFLKNQCDIATTLGFNESIVNNPTYQIITALVRYMYYGSEYDFIKFLLTEPALIDHNSMLAKGSHRRIKVMLDSYLKKSATKSIYDRILDIGNFLSLSRRLGGEPDFYTIINIIAEELPTVNDPLSFLHKLKTAASGNLISAKSADKYRPTVNITTIHGSKGLEYPIVILYNVREDFKLHKNTKYIIDDSAGDSKIHKVLNKNLAQYATAEYQHAIDIENTLDTYEKINKLYVATTRAQNALYLLPEDVKGDNIDSYMMGVFPESFEIGALPEKEKADAHERKANTSLFKTACRQLLHGDYTDIEEYRANAEKTFKYHPTITDESKKLFEKFATETIKLANGAVDSTNEAENYINRCYGEFVHDILFNLNEYNEEDIDKAIQKSWYKFSGYLPKGADLEIRATLLSLFASPEWQMATDGDIYREHPIIYNKKMYIIDHYTVKSDEIIVIDFKTSAPDSARMAEYQEQVKTYMQALEAQYRLKTTGYLLFLHNKAWQDSQKEGYVFRKVE